MTSDVVDSFRGGYFILFSVCVFCPAECLQAVCLLSEDEAMKTTCCTKRKLTMDVDYSVLNTGRCDINKSVDSASKHLSKHECVSLTVYFFLIKSLVEMFVF